MASGTVATNQWSSLTGGGILTITDGSYSLPGLTDVNSSSLYAEGGATLSLPNLSTYTATDNTTFEATGVNSVLNLSALTSLGSMSDIWHAEALAGGTLNLSGLATIDQPNESVVIDAEGSGSQLNLSALTSFIGGGTSGFAVTTSGTALASSLTSFTDVQITLDGTGTVATNQWSSLTGGGILTITDGSYSLPGLTDVNSSSLYAEGGATLSLPNLSTYTATDNTTFEATGTNSVLDLSGLTSLGSMSDIWHAEALAGGTLNLSGLATIDQPNENVVIDAEGSGSQLNLSALTSFIGGGTSGFAVTTSGTALASSLTSFTDVQITLDGTGTVATNQWSSLTGGGILTITDGSYSLPGLTDVNSSSLYAEGAVGQRSVYRTCPHTPRPTTPLLRRRERTACSTCPASRAWGACRTFGMPKPWPAAH